MEQEQTRLCICNCGAPAQANSHYATVYCRKRWERQGGTLKAKCACGCGTPLTGVNRTVRKLYFNTAHRVRHFRAQKRQHKDLVAV